MPTLTVAAAVADRSLVSLDAVKAELGITGTDRDDLLKQWISDDSDAVCAACRVAPDQLRRRTFLQETVTIGFWPNEIPGGSEPAALILPWRLPLDAEALTVTVDSVPLDSGRYELAPMGCMLWRLDGAGKRAGWERGRIVLTGPAGWPLAQVPAELRRAVIDAVTIRWDGKDLNSFLKSQEFEGVGKESYWTGALPDMQGSLSKSVLDALWAAGLVNSAVG